MPMTTERMQKIVDRVFERVLTIIDHWDKTYERQVPVGQKKLNVQQKLALWLGMPDAEKVATWQGWDDEEKAEFMREIAPLLGGDERGA